MTASDRELEEVLTQLSQAIAGENRNRRIAIPPVAALGREEGPRDRGARVYVASLQEAQALHGLEFYAVLVLGVDAIASNLSMPLNRLYVATTRASSYVGMVAENDFPEVIRGALEGLVAAGDIESGQD